MPDTDLASIASTLRNAAELTAKASKNWDNFEAICRDALAHAHAAGIYDERRQERALQI